MKPKPSTRLLFILALSSALLALRPLPPALSQVPQGFNYQAIVRGDGTNQPIVSQPVLIRITIEDGIGTDLYQETHSLSTDEFGIVSIIIGQGTPWGTSDFNEIDWNDEPLQLKTEVQYPVGGSYTVMGTAPLMSVPYAMVADSLGGPLKNLMVKGSATTPDTAALFEVKNTSGQTVFAVYNEGVRIYVNDVDAKGAKGGFAIGGFGTTEKTIPNQYMFISGDSVRFNIDNGDEDKGPKGGFAIGGFGTVKGLTQKYFMVSNDSVRIYVDNADTDKGPKGGFAIGGYGTAKGKPQDLLTVSNDSVRIYIDKAAIDKGPKGGFAIGGFGQPKGFGGYMKITSDSIRLYTKDTLGLAGFQIKNQSSLLPYLDISRSSNILVGENAGKNIVEGQAFENVFIGINSGRLNTDGDRNVYVGKNAGYNNTIGSGNIFIGSQAGQNEIISNKLIIDNSSTSVPLIYGDFTDNYIRINGNLQVTGNAYKPGGGTWGTLSDKRLKDVLSSFDKGLKEILGLKAVVYSYKNGNAFNLPTGIKYIGFIAQDVQEYLPESVTTSNTGFLELDLNTIYVALVNAVKELNQKAQSQQQQIDRLEALVEKLMEK